MTTAQRTNYGVDAPGLVRGFLVGGVAALSVAGGLVARWPGRGVARLVAGVAGLAAAYALGMGSYMLRYSLVGKVRGREQLLDMVPWSSDAAVLDVGCGRGLLLVAAARRVPSGRAVGIDVWQAEDQSGNGPDAPVANARAEGVADRVAVRTADARQIPFPDGSFDTVVSHWVIHNLAAADDRAQALAEMARVLKPGGHILLADIANHAEYVAGLRALGLVDVRHVVSAWQDAIRAAVSFGSFRPGVVLARKPA